MVSGIASRQAGTRSTTAPLPSGSLLQLRTARLPLPVGLYLFTLVVPIWFSAGPLAMNTMRLLLLIMIVPLTVQLLTGRYGRVFLTDILFLLHIFWAAVALAVNNPDRVIQNIGSTGIEFIGGYVLARAFIRSQEDFVALCKWLVILAAISLPLAFYETQTARAPVLQILNSLPGVGSLAQTGPDPRMGLYRAQVVFAHPIHYGMFCAIAFSLCFVALKQTWGTSHRVAVSAMIALCCFFSVSSGGLLAILLQFGLILWGWAFSGFQRRWHFLLAMLTLAYVFVDLLSNRTPVMVFMSYATFNSHTAYWRANIFDWGMINIWANPLFGIGLNDWVRPAWMHTSSVDNFWLLTAMRYGIPGFVLLAVGYFWAIFLIARRDYGGDVALMQFRLAWIFTFVGLTFTLCTVHVWHSLYSFVFFLLGSGIWMSTAQPSTDSASRMEEQAELKALRYTRFPEEAAAQGRPPEGK
jgi:O-antigen ligase